MPRLEEAIDVGVPVRTLYDQWTQFEEFPKFLDDVVEVRQLDDSRLRWTVDGGPAGEVSWEAQITEQHPDDRVAWASIDGPHHAGVVTFHRLSDDSSRAMLQADWDPIGLGDDEESLVRGRVRRELEHFRDFIEHRGEATGAWRDDIDQRAVSQLGRDEHVVLPTGRLRGMDVVDERSDKVGRIAEVYVEPSTDTVRYIGVVTSRLHRGCHVVPIDAVRFERDGDNDPYARIPWSRDRIDASPSLDADDPITRDREHEIDHYYEHMEEYAARRQAIAARQSTPAPTPEIAEAELAGKRPEEVMAERWGV